MERFLMEMYETMQDRMEMKPKCTYQVMREEVAKEKPQTTIDSIQQKGILTLDIGRKRCRFVLDVCCCFLESKCEVVQC